MRSLPAPPKRISGPAVPRMVSLPLVLATLALLWRSVVRSMEKPATPAGPALNIYQSLNREIACSLGQGQRGEPRLAAPRYACGVGALPVCNLNATLPTA